MKRSSLSRYTTLRPINPERQARAKQQYAKGLRAMRKAGVRTAVLLRANFTCELCGYQPEYWTVGKQIKCPDLHVHHGKKQYKGFGGNEDLDRLKALCRWCHIRVHASPDLETLLFPKADPAIGMEPTI